MPAFVVVEVDNEGFKVYDSGGTLIDPAKDATVAAITTALNAIKNTDGIKKITDPLPAGTNEIGKVAQGTKAAAADGWPTVLYDATGNPVGVIVDGSIYRVQVESKLIPSHIGTAGVSAPDVLSVQGIADGTPLRIGRANRPVAQVLDGVEMLEVVDVESRGLLTQILQELRILNMHIAAITDEDIQPSDTE